MKRDIRINYSVLERISLNIKKYKTAIETIKEVLGFVNSKLEAENQGKAIEALKGNYSELEGDLEGCQEELNDLYTVFDGYINEMQDIIRPVSSSSMMQVDRNDIWCNMQSIFQACDEVGMLKINVGTGMSLPSLFQSDEEKANVQKNSRMMEDIGDDIKYCYNRLKDNKDELKNIYDKKVVPYENKDDEYSNKAGRLYFKYTNNWESIVEEGKDFALTTVDLGKGLVNLAGDVLKGGYGLAKGSEVVVGAGVGVVIKSMMGTGDAPDCLKKCITETKGYGKTVSSVLKDPVILAEGMAQSASDTVEEKGIAYSTSYVLGGVLLTKGLSKVSSVSKAGEVVDVEKVSTKVDGGAGKLNYSAFGEMSVEDGKKYDLFSEQVASGEPRWGERPNPQMLLSQPEIDAHLAHFDYGGSYLVTEKTYKQYIRNSIRNPILGRPGELFITTNEEMNNIFLKSKGEYTKIEESLGFDSGTFSSGGGLVRIDIENPFNYDIRMPSGNEYGANPHFEFGGKTDGGKLETVVSDVPNEDLYRTITHIKK